MAESKGPSGDGLKFRATEKRWAAAAQQRTSQRDWALRKLAELEASRPVAKVIETPAKAAKEKRTKGGAKGKGKRVRAAVMDQARIDDAVTHEAQAKGDYRVVPFKLQEVVEGGKVKAKTVSVVRNLSSTQVERWLSRRKLDDRQMAAILCFTEAYRKRYGEGPRVTASYSPAVARGANDAIQLYAADSFKAMETLRLIDNEVVFDLPPGHWDVWINVVIWDEPCGVAGGRLGFSHKPAEAAAYLVVSTIAYKIANLVIDNSRQDFAEYIRQLDRTK